MDLVVVASETIESVNEASNTYVSSRETKVLTTLVVSSSSSAVPGLREGSWTERSPSSFLRNSCKADGATAKGQPHVKGSVLTFSLLSRAASLRLDVYTLEILLCTLEVSQSTSADPK